MKSTIRNFTTAFFAWLVSSILLFVFYDQYLDINGRQLFWMFLTVAGMGICTIAAFFGLMFLSLLSNIFNWSESKDYLLKIAFSITLYLPLLFLMREYQMIPEFWYWSLAGTLAVITFDYKHLFTGHFSFGSKRIPSENH